MRIAAIIVAAGSGTRFGAHRPKQYELLAGDMILRRTIRQFIGHKAIASVHVVISGAHRDLYDQASRGFELGPAIEGGSDRQSSVMAGLNAIQPSSPTHVLIHDAARPLISKVVIDAVIGGLYDHAAVLPVLPVADSLKRVQDNLVAGVIERDGAVVAQTPQGFAYPAIMAAHERFAGSGLSDDTAVAAAAGIEIGTVMGAVENLKITTPEDIRRALVYLGERPMRIACGTGFDVHAFADDRMLMLCGLEIAHERGLAGHSDADVGLHALCDAIFGALADGDIGSHFPPSDAKWRGASSDQFLAFAVRRVEARGGKVNHLDLTLICEAPKIGPYRDRMRVKVAEITGLPLERIAIKATTSEKLGFTGRSEGIAAQAMATLELPQ